VILGVTALALAIIGMVVNARQVASLGMNPDASGLLAAEGLYADLLVLMLPTVAARLWGNRQRVGAATAWAIRLGVIGFTLLATTMLVTRRWAEEQPGKIPYPVILSPLIRCRIELDALRDGRLFVERQHF
jgi:hypothetical protein